MTYFLDDIKFEILEWAELLWDPINGGFKEKYSDEDSNLFNTTDIAWMRYATNNSDLGKKFEDKWIQYLQNSQNKETGLISYQNLPQGNRHVDGHAFLQTLRSLNILKADILYFPKHMLRTTTVEGLEAWFDERVWEGINQTSGGHHNTFEVVPLLINLSDSALENAFYIKLCEQQHVATGTWPKPINSAKNNPNISRTFAYTLLHRAIGKIPPNPERMLDTILSLQLQNGFWEFEPSYHTMDSTYLLVRIPGLIDYKKKESMVALDSLANALTLFWHQQKKRFMQDPHWTLAIVHTFGLLQEAYPERFPSMKPFQFDWDLPSLLQSKTISEMKINI